MPSPFPGMDPYIESKEIWPDFHSDLASEIRARLNTLANPKYYASTITYAALDVIEITESKHRSISPDVSIWQRPQKTSSTGGMAVLDLPKIDLPPIHSIVEVEVSTRFANVEVRQVGSNTLVTSIEILSPVNKRSGPQREKYLRKRREILGSDVHFMEIDLLRSGERSPLKVAPPDAPYYITLSRVGSRPFVDIWPIQLDERLPVLPVPLLSPDPDLPLDLGAVVRSVYERGAYAMRIEYDQPVPPPALNDQQSAWVKELLQP